jgi:glutathione S-transferase
MYASSVSRMLRRLASRLIASMPPLANVSEQEASVPATLVIANKNYSSWSLRAWLAARHAGIAFAEVLIKLDLPDTRQTILRHSPSGKVPAFIDGDLRVHESLAICETLADRVPSLWPADPVARAAARAVSAEMHAGFMALRGALPMNLRATGRRVALTPAITADLDRAEALWADCRQRFGAGGPWLFGAWSIADAMYAPVASRLITYGLVRPGVMADYVSTVTTDPAFVEWKSAALLETEIVAADEAGES